MTSFAPSEALQARIAALEAAIRKHRDYEGDDRCWQDDAELYAVLPEGYTPPRVALMMPEIKRCERYLACRENPNIRYVSPVGEIQRLRSLVQRAYEEGWATGSTGAGGASWDVSRAKANLAPQVTGMQVVAAQDAYAVSVEDLPLWAHTISMLSKAGIKTLGRLAEQRPRDLLALKGFGVSSLRLVRDMLIEYGLELATSCDVPDRPGEVPIGNLDELLVALKKERDASWPAYPAGLFALAADTLELAQNGTGWAAGPGCLTPSEETAVPAVLELAKQKKRSKDAVKSEQQRQADVNGADRLQQIDDIRQWVYGLMQAFVGVNGIRFATRVELEHINKDIFGMVECALIADGGGVICKAGAPQEDGRKRQTGYTVRVIFETTRTEFTAKLPDGSCGFNFTENFAEAMANFI